MNVELLVALAQPDTCPHPFAPGPCFGPFALVSVSYSVVIGVWALGALVILKPRWSPDSSWWRWALGAPAVGWAAAMLAFTIFGGLGWLTWPLNDSPYFFVDWAAVALSVTIQGAYVALAYRQGVPAATS